MEERLTRLQAKLEADESWAEKLFGLETAEQVQGFLKEEGLDFSVDEINLFRDQLLKVVQTGELSDEDLEDVAGGSISGAIVATCAVISCVHTVTRGRW
ncbi:MAG: Nif11-like leader peptide family natural product precursor [Syntrophomonadaceae bacterium]|nr:Nif11-like leader peptide family natural product precursor [Syntrophomonadaceae bacterium]